MCATSLSSKKSIWSAGRDVPAGKGFTEPGRQVLHCTFGTVLMDPELGPADPPVAGNARRYVHGNPRRPLRAASAGARSSVRSNCQDLKKSHKNPLDKTAAIATEMRACRILNHPMRTMFAGPLAGDPEAFGRFSIGTLGSCGRWLRPVVVTAAPPPARAERADRKAGQTPPDRR